MSILLSCIILRSRSCILLMHCIIIIFSRQKVTQICLVIFELFTGDNGRIFGNPRCSLEWVLKLGRSVAEISAYIWDRELCNASYRLKAVSWRALHLRYLRVSWLRLCYLFHEGGPCQIEPSPLICKANQWTGSYILRTSVVKQLKVIGILPSIFTNNHTVEVIQYSVMIVGSFFST